ncbi:MAG: hypothetical protein NT069_02655, partial [Planctomycetota bacterium]|nr:hypothetical protein [Planctomycetota bacterium]
WHHVRLQRFWDANDKLFHDEWEVTKFVQEGDVWRVAKGEHRYRNRNPSDGTIDPQIKYTLEFEVLEQKYGKAVDPAQFRYEIPEGANVRDENNRGGCRPTANPPRDRPVGSDPLAGLGQGLDR